MEITTSISICLWLFLFKKYMYNIDEGGDNHETQLQFNWRTNKPDTKK